MALADRAWARHYKPGLGSVAGLVVAAALAGCGASGCGATGREGALSAGTSGARATPRPKSCPETVQAPRPLPGVSPAQRTAAYWIARAAQRYGDPDQVLLTPAQIVRQNEAFRHAEVDGEPIGQVDLLAPVDLDAVDEAVHERIAYMHERLASGTYVDANGKHVSDDVLREFDDRAPGKLTPTLHTAKANIPLRCGPSTDAFYKPGLDRAFDRNACSTIHEGEAVQVLADWPGNVQLVRTSYVVGWIADDAPLSPALQGSAAEAAVRVVPRPLTRRALLQKAFALLDTPYGWGGHGGGRDCSRFLLDVFGEFGIELPRNSGRQALAGSFSVDVSGVNDEHEKLRIIEAAQKEGIVLLHFPGHIMLYLGKADDGRPMALHSFSEYMVPCKGTHGPDGKPFETLDRVNRVTVSDLDLGRGSSRTSFLQRITQVVVFGPPPGPMLVGAAKLRPAAPVQIPSGKQCEDSVDAAVFHAPQWPYPGTPLRVIVTATGDPSPADLVLVDPDGKQVHPEIHHLGGPPFTTWAQVDGPEEGKWTAILGDGDRTVACERFYVHAGPRDPDALARKAPGPAWEPRWKWDHDTENFYSAFVEQLFTDPVGKEVTWPNLQVLLADPARNLLHDYLGLGEDEKLHLQPDCADLPYFLRAYFAWKLDLPFGFRPCSRGRAGHPPTCGDPYTPLEPIDASDPVEAFGEFIRQVANTVQSATARTEPRDDATDLYPVPLTRAALRPGTVFADPYGHVIVIAAWRPQGIDHYGILLGADAQPDGTVGRRRFWQGSFLFTPDTTDVGAGFKAWRPLVRQKDDQGNETLVPIDNAQLRNSKQYVPYSEQQYQGKSSDVFYDRMDALINPRPLDPTAMLGALVDALEDQVLRRVTSVEIGIQYLADNPGKTIPMPDGYDIFETEGPWEDYSTPSRDMRLLIAIDAVERFPEAVARNPQRFDLEKGADVSKIVSQLHQRLAQELAKRSFDYTRSDGSKQKLTLADVVARQKALEMAYNPNDCVEIRWGAPEGSAERSTCEQHAPAAQTAQMAKYRSWFATRTRPPR